MDSYIKRLLGTGIEVDYKIQSHISSSYKYVPCLRKYSGRTQYMYNMYIGT
jgi:hypothetical protein